MNSKAKNIDTAFRYTRAFSFIFCFGSLILNFYSIYQNRQVTRESAKRIYILSGDQALLANSSDRKEDILVEARDHIRQFHELFFNLDPDEQVIKTHMAKAFYLADGSARKKYDDLKEAGYFSSLISGNISQHIEIDSVQVRTDSYPYFFRLTAKEMLLRATSILTRSLISEGYLREVERSDHNPHGFLIERWMVIENRDLKTEAR